jgi:hypothetical protein
MSSLGEGGEILPQSLVGLPGYVSLEAANHLSFAATFLESPSSVGACAFAVAQSYDCDHVKRRIRFTISARVQPKAKRLPGRGRDRIGAAEMSKRGIAPEAIDVLSRGDEQLHRMADSHAEQTDCARRSSSDERLQLRVELGDLLVQLCDTPGDASQRNLRGLPRVPQGIPCPAANVRRSSIAPVVSSA